MGTLGNPKPWVPYMNSKDCSQGFCSYYCPQWCYIIFPPPPPVQLFPDDKSGPNFSPLVIAIIGILASAFLLVSYYAIISKYCGNMDSARGRETRESNEELQGNEDDPSTTHEPWNTSAATNNGLDEALIKSITVCKYKKEDGLIEGTDCSVCLSEFQEDETLRLLPKCSHAFHVLCIDKWLKSHLNCPLCRANIILVNAASSPPSLPLPLPPTPPPPPPPPPVMEPPLNNENEVVVSGDIEMGIREETLQSSDEVSKTNLGNSEEGDTIIEIRDEDDDNQTKGIQMEECQFQGHIGSSKGREVEGSKSSRVLHCVMSPVAMKRSFSSGRLPFYCRQGRDRNITIPL